MRSHKRTKAAVLTCILLAFAIAFSSFAQAQSDQYSISPESINRRVKSGDFLEIPVKITNSRESNIDVSFTIIGDISRIATMDRTGLNVQPGLTEQVKLTIFGENASFRSGFLDISGSINEQIPINISVTSNTAVPVEALLIEIEPITEKAAIGKIFNFKVGVQNLLSDERYNVTMKYSIDRLDDGTTTYKFDKAFFEESEVVELATSVNIVKEFDMPDFIRPGTYVINVAAEYLDLETSASRTFQVVEPFWDHVFLGIIPVRWLILAGIVFGIGSIGGIVYLKKKAKKKRYTMKIDYGLLPKSGPRTAYLGMVAETTKKTYFDLDQLTIHTLIAGSTGGGKTVSAEVLVEEALVKGVSVIVFDPTAQWSGFLRKNTDKKMFGLYPKFGLKKGDARAFNGNVRQILNARERVDIKRYMKPGEINVFTINKLDPEDADILVANTIREVFHANLPESPVLKLMVIFDEVHRLLPKFGGSGAGFIQIERGAREFRKWGVGLMLISQVLKDFIGETKANINTEVQMRTRDQGDLDRIKTKYGDYMLQSLLKSATGTGMLQNAAYNKGNPYFISFRPLFHEHARLSDEELSNYNKYNDMIDDLEYSIEALEKENIDAFDLKLELKMALDKVKSGSFNMVDIYLDGLKPRVAEQWKKLGKEPPQKRTKLVSESELREEFARAQEARKKFESEKKKEGGSAGGPAAAKVPPLELKNGVMVTNTTELYDAIENMDPDTFKEHVTAQKNDFADWMKKWDAKIGAEVAKGKTKEEILKAMSQK